MEGLEDHLPNARELPEQKHAEHSLHVSILACHYLRRWAAPKNGYTTRHEAGLEKKKSWIVPE